MKRLTLLAIAVVAVGLVITAVYAAQGPGRGLGARAGQQGLPCPYGYDQPGPQGGWWTRVQPTTPEQKAFVKEVASLHEKIRAKQFELVNLKASDASQDQIAKVQAELDSLRKELHKLMYENRELRRQMCGRGMGRGQCGYGYGTRRGR